jgi:CBS domain-containing protein
MTTDMVTVSPEVTIRDAMALFATRHVSGAPVLASGKVVGVVTATDLMELASSIPGVPSERPEPEDEDQWERAEEEIGEEDESSMAFFADTWEDAGAEVSERMREVGGPEWNALEEHTVSEAMTRDLFSLPPDTPVEMAAGRMRDAKVHRVLVMEDAVLLGIVTTTDITDAVADHKLTAHRYVFSPKVDVDGRSWR